MNDSPTENQHLAFFRKVVALQKAVGIEAPHMHGIVAYADRLEEALRGLLTFRENKIEWDKLSDHELKPLLDAAFQRAREALYGW